MAGSEQLPWREGLNETQGQPKPGATLSPWASRHETTHQRSDNCWGSPEVAAPSFPSWPGSGRCCQGALLVTLAWRITLSTSGHPGARWTVALNARIPHLGHMTESCSPGADHRPGVALALQGGGAHGAFTWGVLDRLVENGLAVGAVWGVSSGATLGTRLVQGLVRGGNAGARRERLQPVAHPVSQPPAHPVSQPAAPPVSQRTAPPTSQSAAAHPTSQSAAAHPASRPAAHPASRAAGDPGSPPASPPTSHLAGDPAHLAAVD